MLVHLRHERVSVVADVSTGVPMLVHWGAPLDDGTDLRSIGRALQRPIVHGGLDVVAPCSLVPEHGAGWGGRPGLAGSRPDGTGWAPRFASVGEPVVDAHRLVAEAAAEPDGLRLITEIELDPPSGIVIVQLTLTNTGDTPYSLERLAITLPIAEHASELLTFEGRWTREFHDRRSPWPVGAFAQENRRGRTSHEHPPLVFAGEAGFGEWSGEVWGAHLAWSGNHEVFAEHLAAGHRYVQLGELLHPGELVLAPGASYRTPRVLAVHGHGLTAATQQFHRHVRANLPERAGRRSRPVLLNTWEAVYFDHRLDRLKALADVAAAVGIERFVLDDGWFGGRRDDRRGLGDWWVSPDAHPGGLTPLIDHVTSLGMQFGIWIEPEMVNPDSDLYRAHPEWVMATPGYDPVLARHQLLLDLAHPDAYSEILTRLDALLADHDISYVKWDMNRDHVQASNRLGGAGTHDQTIALYRLLAELGTRHPSVEIESCASGGARIDAAILRYTDRVWTSDCNDAHERIRIQRGASMLVPPEVMGAHIGPTRSHTTGRVHSLAFRAATAFFGHLGVEWNLLDLTESERGQLAEVISLHQRHRLLLHSGDVVRFDRPDPSTVAHGVYAADRREAIVSFTQVDSSPSLSAAPLRLPGLVADLPYRVVPVPLPGLTLGTARSKVDWWGEGVTLSGRQLGVHGIRIPPLHPDSTVILHLAGSPDG